MVQLVCRVEVRDIDNVLMKFRHIESIGSDYIEAIRTDKPDKYLKLIKEVGSIVINGDAYKYCFDSFIPSFRNGFLNVVNIYIEEI